MWIVLLIIIIILLLFFICKSVLYCPYTQELLSPLRGDLEHFYIYPLEDKYLGIYANEIIECLSDHPKRVLNIVDASYIIIPYSNEANYPNYDMKGGPSKQLNLNKLIDKIGGNLPCITFLHTSPPNKHRRMINIGYHGQKYGDIVLPPPSLKNYEFQQIGSVRKYIATFKGSSTRSNIRKRCFDALQKYHNDKDFIICGSKNSQYNYNDLINNSLYAFVIEGDLPWSYRFSEVISAGCIPIIIKSDWEFLPFHHIINWDKYAIVISLEDIEHTIPDLLKNTNKIIEMQHGLSIIYKKYLQSRKIQINTAISMLKSIRVD